MSNGSSDFQVYGTWAAVVMAALAFAWNFVGQFFSFVSRKEQTEILQQMEKRWQATLEAMEKRWHESLKSLREDTDQAHKAAEQRYLVQVRSFEDTLVRLDQESKRDRDAMHKENKDDRHAMSDRFVKTCSELSVQIAEVSTGLASLSGRLEEQREQARRSPGKSRG